MKTDRYLFRGIIAQPDELFSGFAYGDLLQYANGDVVIRQRETWQEWNVIPETVGQFTGLTDKNGTKVFSDDLMKSPEGDIFRIYQVAGGFVIKASYWMLNTKDIVVGDNLIFEDLSHPQTAKWIEQCEVIGNIHDK